MKRLAAALLCAALMLLCLAGCTRAEPREEGGGPLIVATVFPEYDWVRQILGQRQDAFRLELLLDSGTDMHSFQPTARDMMLVSGCDLFVYVGGESDSWVQDALREAVNPDMETVCLMEVLADSAWREEVREGMQADEEEEEGEAYDEHVWLSLRRAAAVCRSLADAVSRLDPDGAEIYAANAREYTAKLDELDKRFSAAAGQGRVDTLVFADRFPFLYLMKDLGLDYYAAFPGCSAETEAGFDTVIFLADRVRELGLGAVLTIDGSDGKVARAVAENCGGEVAILTMDSMQSVTAQDIAGGETYLGIMEKNLQVLESAVA